MTRCTLSFVTAALLILPARLPAQQAQATPGPSAGSSYTLDVRTGLVIEDVSVTDKHGNAVTGLPRSAFHLADNGVEQHLLTVSENQDTVPSPPEHLSAGSFSNAALYREQGTTVAMLVDNYSMAIPDQMYLRLQMQRYLQTMEPGTRVALFRIGRNGAPVLIQPLTSDRAQMTQAINSILPAMLRPISSTYGNAVSELQNIAEVLRPVPGRKALLWFSGVFPLYLDPEYCNAVSSSSPSIEESEKVVDCNALNDVRKDAFQAMQQARIAVYPIDVRGVLVLPGLTRPAVAGGVSNGASNAPTILPREHTSELLKAAGQYDIMDQLGDATGGHAFYSNNAVSEVIRAAVTLATRSYTLSYRPEPGLNDGKWHKVQLKVDGPYTVHYRTGYFAGQAVAPERPILRAGGTKVTPVAPSLPDPSPATADGMPIVFRARVQADGTANAKEAQFKVEYSIPPQELAFNAAADGTQHARVRLFVLAYNTQGDVLGHAVDVFETKFSPTQMSVAARIGTPAPQTVAAGKGSEFLLLAVEDLTTHHIGTLQIPIRALETKARADGP